MLSRYALSFKWRIRRGSFVVLCLFMDRTQYISLRHHACNIFIRGLLLLRKPFYQIFIFVANVFHTILGTLLVPLVCICHPWVIALSVGAESFVGLFQYLHSNFNLLMSNTQSFLHNDPSRRPDGGVHMTTYLWDVGSRIPHHWPGGLMIVGGYFAISTPCMPTVTGTLFLLDPIALILWI